MGMPSADHIWQGYKMRITKIDWTFVIELLILIIIYLG